MIASVKSTMLNMLLLVELALDLNNETAAHLKIVHSTIDCNIEAINNHSFNLYSKNK